MCMVVVPVVFSELILVFGSPIHEISPIIRGSPSNYYYFLHFDKNLLLAKRVSNFKGDFFKYVRYCEVHWLLILVFILRKTCVFPEEKLHDKGFSNRPFWTKRSVTRPLNTAVSWEVSFMGMKVLQATAQERKGKRTLMKDCVIDATI